MKRVYSNSPDPNLRWAVLALVGLLLLPLSKLDAAPSPDMTMRFGFSHSLFGAVKKNEARTAIEFLASSVAQQRKNSIPLSLCCSATQKT